MMTAAPNTGAHPTTCKYCGKPLPAEASFCPFCEQEQSEAEKILLENEITILITLGDGSAEAEAYGCDLTYDYVKINGDYRT